MASNGGHGLHWCGGLSGVKWLGSPCSFESMASTLLLATTLVILLAQGRRLALIQQLRAHGKQRRGVSGLNGAFIACALFLCGTHILHFSASLALLRRWPFHITYHVCLAVAWATITSFAIYTGRMTASVDFRAVTVPAALVYSISLYSFYRLYFDPHGVPLSYIKASIWTDMLQAVVAAAISWLGWRVAAACPSFATLAAQLGQGYMPLPTGDGGSSGSNETETEAAAAAAPGAKPPAASGGGTAASGESADKSTWISLFVDACAYVWPERLGLRLRVVGCVVLLVAMRAINLGVPILYKRVVDELAAASNAAAAAPSAGSGRLAVEGGGVVVSGLAQLGNMMTGVSQTLMSSFGHGQDSHGLLWGAAVGSGSGGEGRLDGGASGVSFGSLVWPWVVLYLGAVFFQGGAGGGIVGFINNMRSFLWIPVSQDAYRRASLRLFDHVLSMDLTFHLRKKTGEVTRVVDRGTNAMQNILSTVLFNVLPQMLDVLAAATYLAQALEPTIAIIVFITVGSYIPLTVAITEWRGKLRREMNTTDQVKSGRATDALLNYETVKYFTNEKHESQQYAAAIDAYQNAESKSMRSINFLNVVQSSIMFIGISAGLLVCTDGVSAGVLTVGDVVLFLSLMAQLYGPLNFFGTYYRTIQQYMIDMENMFELLDRRPEVEDCPTSQELVVTKGELVFDDVSFCYEPGNPVLRHVSFRVSGGRTIAFVGATGSGKSTITRLIFRFYNVTTGAVRIDGQDVRHVTQHSLRGAIGMVPQDTVLFNDTILHNIRYGNLAATDEQVFEAARLACIHDTIVNRFPKGYDTIVGERGLRLSGGEKQRVAFARALLKNPTMLVLDEATSALDTITEKKIQAALSDLRTDRTTVIVAHRLSTIADADVICVMAAGQVVETGGHTELLLQGGLYADMWARQAANASQGEGSGGASSGVGSTVDLTHLGRASGDDNGDGNGAHVASARVSSDKEGSGGGGGEEATAANVGEGAVATLRAVEVPAVPQAQESMAE